MAVNKPPGDGTGRLPVDLRPRRLMLLPYNDLIIDQGRDDQFPIDPKGFSLTLGMVYGLGPNEPRVLRTDDSGNLLVSSSVGTGGVRISDTTGTFFAQVTGGVPVDAYGLSNFLQVLGLIELWNGSTVDKWRDASAANLAATSGLGAALSAPPGQWAVSGNGGIGAQTTASKAAGAAGVRHVCTGYSFVISSQVAPAAGAIQVSLRDGASGAGTLLHSYIINLPAAVYPAIVVMRDGLNIAGSAATAMTLESSAAYAAVSLAVEFEGYDAL